MPNRSGLVHHERLGFLDYEVRAIARDGADVWLGTKGGTLYRYTLAVAHGAVSGEAIWTVPSGSSIRAIGVSREGLADADAAAFVGLESGVVWRVPVDNPAAAAVAFPVPDGAAPAGAVRDLTVRGGQAWALYDGCVIRLTPTPGEAAPIPRPASWMFAVNDGLLVFADDGWVLHVGMDRKVVEIKRLRRAPVNVVASDRPGSFLVTHEHGLDAITVHDTGLREVTVFSGRVTAAGVHTFYGEAALVVAARGGKVFSTKWDGASPPSARWRRWPALSIDVCLLAFDPEGHIGLAVLQDHEVRRIVTQDVRLVPKQPDPGAQFDREFADSVTWMEPLKRRQAARRLRTRLLAAAADAEESARTGLVQRARLLQKYGIEINSFFAKRQRLRDLIRVNQHRPLDRMIYGAQVDEQRFDVIASVDLDGRVFALDADGSGGVLVGQKEDSRAVVRRWSPSVGLPKNPTWTANSGHPTVLRASRRGEAPYLRSRQSRQTVYSALLDENGAIVAEGLDNHEVRWGGGDARKSRLPNPHRGPTHAVGNQRVRVLLSVGGAVFAGSEAGGIYRLNGPDAEPRLVAYVDAPVWSGVALPPNRCVVGTASGDVLFFEAVPNPNGDLGLRLTARDRLFSSLIGAVFASGPPEARRVMVVALNGTIALYEASVHPPDSRPTPQPDPPFRVPFTGMRVLTARPARGSVTAAALVGLREGPALAIAYDLPHGGHRLDLVHPVVERSDWPSESDFLVAWGAVAPVTARRTTVLRSIPAPNPALRALAARIDAAEVMEPESKLGPMFEAALRHHPGSRTEFKALLDAVRARMAPFWTRIGDQADGLRWYRAASSTLVRTTGWRGDPKLKAAVARKLLCPAAFGGQTDEDRAAMERWIELQIDDPSPIVRLESLQALADSLFLIRISERAADCFPEIAHVGQILRPVARFLAARPPADTRPESASAEYWTALMVVRQLMRLFPDAVWSVCDHLVVAGVRRVGLSMLRSMLDDTNRRRMDQFTPDAREGDGPDTPLEMIHFLEEALDAPPGAGADRGFQAARAPYYRWLLDGFRCWTLDEMREHLIVGAALRKPCVARLWPGRESASEREREDRGKLFCYLDSWLRERLCGDDVVEPWFPTRRPSDRDPPPAEAVAAHLRRLADEITTEAENKARPVLEPEDRVVAVLLRAWAAALLRSTLQPGDVIPLGNRRGWVRVGDTETNHSWVSIGYDGADKDVKYVVRARPVGGDAKARAEHRSKLHKAWNKVKAAPPGKSLPKIYRVIEREWCVLMVMAHAGDRMSLAAPAPDAPALTTLTTHVATALEALHDANLWHGDVRWDNIVKSKRGNRYTLVDFGHLGPVAAPLSVTEMQPMPYTERSHRWWSARREPARVLPRAMQGDVLALCGVVAEHATPTPGHPTHSIGVQLAVAVAEADVARALEIASLRDAREHPLVRLVRRHLLAPLAGEVRVFVAYTRLDPWSLRFVQTVRAAQRLPGVSLFIDEFTGPGEDWAKRIRRELMSADIIVVCLSSHWMLHPWVVKHERPAIELKADDPATRLLVLPAGPVADHTGFLQGRLQAAWPLDEPPDPTDPKQQDQRLAEAMTQLFTLIGAIAAQDQ